jgi:hypothetical protein
MMAKVRRLLISSKSVMFHLKNKISVISLYPMGEGCGKGFCIFGTPLRLGFRGLWVKGS